MIDVLALRVGNEKGEDEAETYGACSLLVSHVKLTPPVIGCLFCFSARYYHIPEKCSQR